MFEALFSGPTGVYWGVAGVLALGLVGVKLVQMNLKWRESCWNQAKL